MKAHRRRKPNKFVLQGLLFLILGCVWSTYQVSHHVDTPTGEGKTGLTFSLPAELVENHTKSENVVAESPPQTFGFSLQEKYQNPEIISKGCSITVVLMDPNVGLAATWSLESAAINIHPLDRVCIFIQTSVCRVLMPGKNSHRFVRNTTLAYRVKAQQIEEQSLPNFLDMIRNGQVRMTVLDYKKYNLKTCSDFFSPSYAWENYRYWGPDEFLDVDSDRVLTIQDDAVLCQTLGLSQWENVAWVGAPWPPQMGNQLWHICSAMPRNWEGFHKRRNATVPPGYPDAKSICSDVAVGPQGNGGLSIRSRQWLRRAIMYCPTNILQNSGLSAEEHAAATCHADQIAAEDSYFVTILRGLGAPLPSVWEAALFSWETRSINSTLTDYQVNETWKDEMIRGRWYSSTGGGVHDSPLDKDSVERYRAREANDPKRIVPIALHKPWNSGFRNEVCHPTINEQCPLLRHVVENNHYGQKLLREYKAKTGEDCFPLPSSSQ